MLLAVCRYKLGHKVNRTRALIKSEAGGREIAAIYSFSGACFGFDGLDCPEIQEENPAAPLVEFDTQPATCRRAGAQCAAVYALT